MCQKNIEISIHGANALSKICVLCEKFKIEDLEKEMPIDARVADWINAIEKDIKKNKQYRANRKETEDLPVKRGTIDSNIKY